MLRKLTIHCHFYQPPRENPWTEQVEVEKSAFPYKNWNERIAHECYSRLVPVLPFLSHNWGPTLLKWMRREMPGLYEDVRRQVSRHRNALMQPYYHAILPLCDSLDKRILLEWGKRSFRRCFGYLPLGVWLPELAVDLETLKAAEDTGLRFAVLGSHQVKAGVPGLYRICGLRNFCVFAFDRSLSGKIAFAPCELFEPKSFVKFMRDALGERGPYTVIALDGETFGHHKKGGDKALKALVGDGDFRLTDLNGAYSLFFRHFRESEVVENTSWSCAHGIERWRGDCGCNTGAHPGWNQRWRVPLREAVDWLKAKIDEIFFSLSPEYFKDPEKALLDYVFVVDGRNFRLMNRFLRKHLKRTGKKFSVDALKLVEMKNAALAMFTSCGWFFDDISGIESQIVMRYAKRAMELAFDVSSTFLEGGFLNILSKAESNVKEYGTGKDIYLRFVAPLSKTHEEQVAQALKEHEAERAFLYGSVLVEVVERRKSFEAGVCFETLKVLSKSVILGDERSSYFIRLSSAGGRFVFPVDVDSDERWAELQERLHEAMKRDLIGFFLEVFTLIQP